MILVMLIHKKRKKKGKTKKNIKRRRAPYVVFKI